MVTGGEGADKLRGGDGGDIVRGGANRDNISGGTGDDKLFGDQDNDTIYANKGVDESFGGDGNDQLWALAQGDVTSIGDAVGDTLHGENGNDTFHTRDNEVDHVDCGPGKDTAEIDLFDQIVDATPANPKGSCETRRIKAPVKNEDKSREQAGVVARRLQAELG